MLNRVIGRGVMALTMAAAMASAAHAGLLVSGSVGGAPTGVTKENFDAAPLGAAGFVTATGITVSFAPDAAAVQGSSSGVYAAPYLSGGNGLGFGAGGGNQPDGADATSYLTSGSTGSHAQAAITLGLPGLEKYFGLLWGSVDAYNTLSFYNGATLVGSVTGGDVTGSPNGDQGVNGTLYVNISATGGDSFDRVVATSSQYAFELDNVAFNPTAVPEPVTLSMLGVGLLGLGIARRKRA
jgi:hypothetical protein